MTVSAVVPTYNRRAQVMLAIDSVLAQTSPVDEIVVVDDGSTDGTAESVRDRYGSRVKLIKQENAGVSAARNHGIREARGEWIAFLDSDDTWFPAKIERQLQAVSRLGNDFGLCFTDCVYGESPDAGPSIFEENHFHPIGAFGEFEGAARAILTGKGPAWTPSLLIRRVLLNDEHGFDESLTIGEDADLIFRLSFRTKFCFIAEPLVRIDRAPHRQGLSNTYSTRDDRIYDDIQKRLTKWWTMPGVVGTELEDIAFEKLRDVTYDSAECKIHELRIGPALREISRLTKLEASYASVASNLVSRKVAKMRRNARHRELVIGAD